MKGETAPRCDLQVFGACLVMIGKFAQPPSGLLVEILCLNLNIL